MRSVFGEIVGNRRLCNRFYDDLQQGTLAHAYILEGPFGSGKHTIALSLTAALSCENKNDKNSPLPCRTCASCRKILGGNSTDLIVKSRADKATLGVETVRQIKQDLLVPPNDGDVKVYLIEDVHLMTHQAQNALLLSLEEPPPYVLFLLLCESAAPLLETIRSRAPILRTRPVPDEEIRAFLKERRISLSEEDLAAVLLRADGCIGQALTLADSRAVKPIIKLRGLCDAFMEAYAARRYDTLPAVLGNFGSKRDGVSEVIAMATLAVRDLILLRHGESVKLKYYTDRSTAEELAARFTTRALLRIYQALGSAADSLEGNGNVRLTLMQLAVDITP
jgi:DNA polymerase-3 subunit delta'